MNTQQALSKCFNYFLTHKPGYRYGGCVYYANGSRPVRCAIGCLLPKQYEKEAGECGGRVDELFKQVPAIKRFFNNVDPWVLDRMQSAHDYWAEDQPDFGCFDNAPITRELFLDYLQTLLHYSE